MVRFINGKPYSIGNFPDDNRISNSNLNSNKKAKATCFKDIFNDTLKKDDEFKISNHAFQRIKELNLTKEDHGKLKEAFHKAKEKGSKNSVFLYKDIAFIASIENKTIITAVEKERAKENVFTNIDSVVIL